MAEAVTRPRAFDGRPILPGTAEGRVLKLTAPISFWGGIDPETGIVTYRDHPQRGRSVSGRILVVPRTIGSSSSSSILLELLWKKRGPAGLVLGSVDAILLLGAIVGEDLGLPPLPSILIPEDLQAGIPDDGHGRIDGGRLSVTSPLDAEPPRS